MPIDPVKWTAVINAVDTLITHVAACEMWLDERHLMQQARRGMHVSPSMQPSAMQALAPSFKLVFAQIATACAKIADSLTGMPTPGKVCLLQGRADGRVCLSLDACQLFTWQCQQRFSKSLMGIVHCS